MHSRFKRDLDPLDRELLERAFEGAWAVVKENGSLVDLDSDQALEETLRRELIEIACSNGVSDAETSIDEALKNVPTSEGLRRSQPPISD